MLVTQIDHIQISLQLLSFLFRCTLGSLDYNPHNHYKTWDGRIVM